jgi:hypothetical protein
LTTMKVALMPLDVSRASWYYRDWIHKLRLL